MRLIPENLIAEIRQKSDIVETISSYLTLSKRGKNYWGVCPFHDDHNPSMSVSPEKQIYKCFGCGAGGNVFTFIQHMEKLQFHEAVAFQGRKVHVEVPLEMVGQAKPMDPHRALLFDILDQTQVYSHYTLYSDEGKAALNTLYQRGYHDDLIKHFGIGVALDGNRIYQFLKAKGYQDEDLLAVNLIRIKDKVEDVFMNRLMFPIADVSGRVVGFSARTLDPNNKVKYINTSETPLYVKGAHIFNLDKAKDKARKEGVLYLCEGVTDVMAFYQAGYENAVAMLGVACTDEQVKLLRTVTKNVCLAFDGDTAGYTATYNIGSKLVASGFTVTVWYNDSGKDPDEIYKAFGKKRFDEGIEQANGWYDFLLTYHIGLYGTVSFEDKKRVAMAMAQQLANADDLTRSYYLKLVAEKTGFDLAIIQALITPQQQPVKPVLNMEQVSVANRLAILKSEQELLKQMLLSKKAAHSYRNQLGFLPSQEAHDLALMILDLYRSHDTIEVADLYSLNLDQPMQQFVSALIEAPGVHDYKESVVLEAIARIQSVMTDKNIKEIRANITQKTFHEQLEGLDRAIKSKRKTNGGR